MLQLRRFLMLLSLYALARVRSMTPIQSCIAPGDAVEGYVDFSMKSHHCLRDLQPNTRYEVRLSSPGSVPVSWTLELRSSEPPLTPFPGPPPHHPAKLNNEALEVKGRRLLDTDKLVFDVNADGAVELADGPSDQIELVVSGIPLRGFATKISGAHYSLIVDPLLAKAVPRTAVSLIPAIAGAVLLTGAIVALLMTKFSIFRDHARKAT